MIKEKRTIIQGTDGVLELFELQEDFLPGSVWVMKKLLDSSLSFESIVEFGTTHVRISPPPEVGSELLVFYQAEVPDEVAGLSTWDANTLLEMTKAMGAISSSLTEVMSRVDKRVTIDNFDRWAELIEATVNKLELTIINK